MKTHYVQDSNSSQKVPCIHHLSKAAFVCQIYIGLNNGDSSIVVIYQELLSGNYVTYTLYQIVLTTSIFISSCFILISSSNEQ